MNMRQSLLFVRLQLVDRKLWHPLDLLSNCAIIEIELYIFLKSRLSRKELQLPASCAQG